MSGTRSNPPHSPDYGADYAQGGYADLTGGQTAGYAGAPYAGGEGSSEAAEYYYEDQYGQQHRNEYSQYDQYAESSAGYYEQAGQSYQQDAYPQQGYEGAGYDGQGYAADDGFGVGTQPFGEYAGGYGQYETEPGYAENNQGQARYTAESGYAEPTYQASESQYGETRYSEAQAQYGESGYPEPGYPAESGYAAETPYAEAPYGQAPYPAASDDYATAAYHEGDADFYDGPGGRPGSSGAPLFGAAASFAAAGTATAAATDTLVADPSTLGGSPLGDFGLDSPVSDPMPDTAAVPGPRRSRAATAAPTRPATRTDDVGKPPKVLRTRPRTGPLGRIVQGTVLAALVAGAVTYVAYDKTITLSVDGQTQTVHSFADTVGAVLAADGISTGSRDVVSPAPGATASDNETITVRYGRPLSLSVNGVATKTWVHYPTVAGALQELGVRTAGAKSSESMSADIPRTGMTGLVVYTLRHITFLVDGKTMQLATTAATVTQAMAQAGVVLHNQDAPSVAANSVPTDGETISINRITGTTETKQVSIPFTTTKVSDPTQYTGTSSVKTEGVDGVETVTYAVLVVNGVKQAPKQISETVTKQPVNEVLSVGTKALPSSASDLNWAALANCESGGNPAENTGNGFYGMYQFTISTWDSLGGSGLPSDASAATQTALAEKLYTEAGAGQWPVCGHYLFS